MPNFTVHSNTFRRICQFQWCVCVLFMMHSKCSGLNAMGIHHWLWLTCGEHFKCSFVCVCVYRIPETFFLMQCWKCFWTPSTPPHTSTMLWYSPQAIPSNSAHKQTFKTAVKDKWAGRQYFLTSCDVILLISYSRVKHYE